MRHIESNIENYITNNLTSKRIHLLLRTIDHQTMALFLQFLTSTYIFLPRRHNFEIVRFLCRLNQRTAQIEDVRGTLKNIAS